jgi:hypothetical protein
MRKHLPWGPGYCRPILGTGLVHTFAKFLIETKINTPRVHMRMAWVGRKIEELLRSRGDTSDPDQLKMASRRMGGAIDEIHRGILKWKDQER